MREARMAGRTPPPTRSHFSQESLTFRATLREGIVETITKWGDAEPPILKIVNYGVAELSVSAIYLLF